MESMVGVEECFFSGDGGGYDFVCYFGDCEIVVFFFFFIVDIMFVCIEYGEDDCFLVMCLRCFV